MGKVTVTSKWDGELKFTWKWFLRKFRVKLKQSMQAVFDTYSGKLFESYKAKATGKNSVTFTSHLKQAGALEFGAQIPDRFPSGLAMKFQGTNAFAGQTVFAKKASGFFLRPRPYLEPAIQAWALGDTEVAWVGDD